MNKTYKYKFTVSTPTYNRKHTLSRVYESLKAQTFRDFEWIIIDDGSKDGTGDLVKQWKETAEFPIRYFYQENSGKHVAVNKAVRESQGELFLIFDSDDACVPNTLERFKYHWDIIPEKDRDSFSTIRALCFNQNGNIVGKPYPAEQIVVSSVYEQIKFNTLGEKWNIERTDLLRENPFPEITGEKFIPEGIVWNRLSSKYKTKFINEKLRKYEPAADSLSAKSILIRINSPIGTRTYYKEAISFSTPVFFKIKNLVNYIRFSLHSHLNLKKIINESSYPFLIMIFFPLGYLFFKIDLTRFTSKAK